MKDQDLIGRLRAARPMAAEPGDHTALFAQIVAEPGDSRLLKVPQERAGLLGRKAQRWGHLRPRILASSTLGLAGVGAALVLALGGSEAPPAFAITNDANGVLVNINRLESLPAANQKLTEMGIHEQVTIYMASGPAAVSGPVTCTPPAGANVPGPQLKVLIGTDGTEVISPGQTGGNTGVGAWHLNHCVVSSDSGAGAAGNTGAG